MRGTETSCNTYSDLFISALQKYLQSFKGVRAERDRVHNSRAHISNRINLRRVLHVLCITHEGHIGAEYWRRTAYYYDADICRSRTIIIVQCM